jgi:DEAD/DEAH box helicase domain-containing protein
VAAEAFGKIVLESFLEWLGRSKNYQWDLVHHEVLEKRDARLEPIPEELDPRARALVRACGIETVYSHQAEAIRLSLQGRNVVLSTSTASGKTLAYQAPVVDRLLQDPLATALFLFPLKALERDQRDAFISLAGSSGITAAAYDGDTPESERRKIRNNPPRVIITNPDMLHLSVLGYHDSWKEFLGHLCYVVLDEVHAYKGIFGSHISQVILRMKRICAAYKSRPQFMACSATIANPGEFVSKLIAEDVAVVDRSGAASSRRNFVFVNPNLSPYTVAARVFVAALQEGLKTIVFTRARKITELITMWVISDAPHLKNRISSYRAGFLPEERREIEAKLFSGQMDGVISTSALEMGIDVGGLDLCVLVGYPGTIINTWQRGGRVGRGSRPSAIVLIAGTDALDQYFMRNPSDFFQRDCEQAVLDPGNKEVLKRHIPCAAAEFPISPEEEWIQTPEIQAIVEELEADGAVFRFRDGSIRCPERRPHRHVDLRSIGDSYGIFLEDRKTLIGSSSGARAFKECHKGAVYLHRTKQYVVKELDLERRNVVVTHARLNYYTRAHSEKTTTILRAPIRSREFPGFIIREAQLKVTEIVDSYEKRRTSGQDLIGVVDLQLPPIHFETVGIWIEIPDKIREGVTEAGLHFMGGIHAMEHAAISMFPLFALCDRDDIGGISTPQHEQVGKAAVFIYDGHPGGVGLAHRAFDVIEELLEKTRVLVETCKCEDGCPSCIHSPKCGSGNKPLDKQACLVTLEALLHPEEDPLAKLRLPPSEPPVIFPDLVNRGHDSGRRKIEQSGDLVPDRVSKPKTLRRRKPGHSDVRNEASTTEAHETESRLIKAAPSDALEGALIEMPQGVVVFDLETRKLAEEVGGWKHISRMGLSLAVTYSREDGFLTFTEETVSDLVAVLKRAALVVGFNHMRFDYEVLRPYTRENLRGLPNLDILLSVKGALGHRVSLDQLAEATLKQKKSGHGLDAVKWLREGKIDLLEKYCQDDVRITADLYRFGLTHRHLKYASRTGKPGRVPVDWMPPGM